jgi:hypothetical protein
MNYACGCDRPGFEGTVRHHIENIYNVVLETVSFIKSDFMVVVHGELASTHLDHSIIDLI